MSGHAKWTGRQVFDWAESEVLVGAKRPEEGKTKTMSKQTESHAASAPLPAGPVQPAPAASPSESFCTWPDPRAYAVRDVLENNAGAMGSPSWQYDCWASGPVAGFHSMWYQLPEQRGCLHQPYIWQAADDCVVEEAWPPEEMVPGASSAADTVYSDTSYGQVHYQ